MTDLTTSLQAVFLGVVEGLTEFLPVSSTGHLILMQDLMGFQESPGHVFDIVIQLGAILAVVAVYFGRLWRVLVAAPSDPASRRFIAVIFLGFLPAMLIGAVAHDFIKSVLFNPLVVAVSLVLGGVAILLIERAAPQPAYGSIEKMSFMTALKIGLFQCIAMIPGVSRSGATIMGAMLLRVERKTAAEFSFFLAIPTMVAASAYDIMKNWHNLDSAGMAQIGIGFVAAFLSALVVVKGFISFVGKHGFSPFAWYRICVGLVIMALIAF